MKIKVLGTAVVIESGLKAEDIALLQEVKPDALTLKDEDGCDVFSIGYINSNEEYTGGITRYGIVFTNTTRCENKYASITLPLPSGFENDDAVKDYILKQYALAIHNLETLEALLPEVIAEVSHQRQVLRESIEIL